MTTSLRSSGLGAAPLACWLLALAGCSGGHDAGLREVGADDCSACHLAEYQGTTQPYHPAKNYSLACVGCHDNAFWRPPISADLHPNDMFRISSGPHSSEFYACDDCHDPAFDLTSTDGANTNCVGCHTGAHSRGKMDEVHINDPDYPKGDPRPNFCLDCHPDGRFEP
jgi:hypothetical protein